MDIYQKSLEVLETLFARDYQFALATSQHNVPSARYIDAYYHQGAFYLITYGKSKKVQDIEDNPHVSLTHKLYRFSGLAQNIGHPLKEENKAIRELLVQAFAPWYFLANNEHDEHTCFIKITLTEGFFYQDGTGYKVDFRHQRAEAFPFTFDITLID
jgi:general stress protein 26